MKDQTAVLIVDDEVSITLLLSMKIKGQFPHFQIHTAHNGKEAFQKIQSRTFDLIVADIDMPIMNGLELLNQLKKNQEFSSIPFIIITGKSAKDTAIHAVKSGAYDYIEKPFEDEELFQSIQRAVEKRNLEFSQMAYQQELENTNALLQKTTISKTFFENVIASFPAAIIVIDKNQNVQFCGGKNLVNYGVSSEASQHETTSLSKIISPLIMKNDVFIKKIELAFSQSENQSIAEFELQQNIYHTIYLNIQMTLVSEFQLLIILSDITHQVHYQKELAKNDRLQSIAALSSGIAHEIRNPLGIVLGHTQTLKRFLKDTDNDTLHSLDVIEAQVQRANKIIQQLFEFGRDNQEPIEPFEIVNITNLMDETLSLLSYSSQTKSIIIDFEKKDSVFSMVSKTQLQQVFINILKNAFEAFNMADKVLMKNNPKISIIIDNDKNEKKVFVTVIDNGSGIHPEKIHKVFDPFYTTKQNGGGMGLAVCQMIIQQHRGKMSIHNNREGGVSVCITLPAYEHSLQV